MGTVMAHQQLLIGGEWTDAASGREYEQRFPYTGEVIGRAAAAGPEDARAAVDAARAALVEFTELRWITVQEQPREYPI
jgi:phenylacetaldehyde dehydrogenase